MVIARAGQSMRDKRTGRDADIEAVEPTLDDVMDGEGVSADIRMTAHMS